MGKVSAPVTLKVGGKMASFSANLSAKTSSMPANLGGPFYVSKHVVRYVV
jgi:hypothetical protein